MTSPLELCRGLTRHVYETVPELLSENVVERRGYDHPIYQHEIDAENAALDYLLGESKKDPELKIVLGHELKPRWFCIKNGMKDERKISEVERFEPNICFLCDAIEGSKADVPVFTSSLGEPIPDGNLYEVFSTAIGFYIDRPTLKDAECASLQRWDGRQYFADKHHAYVEFQGKKGIVEAGQLDEIGLRTKIYGAGHYGHVSQITDFVIQGILKEFGIIERDSPGNRATGSTTYDMLMPSLTRSIAFDIRDVVKKELEKLNFGLEKEGKNYRLRMERGAYTHDFAPPAFFAKRTGTKILNLDGTEFDCNLLEYKTASFFEAPMGKAGNQVLSVLQEKILPKIPEKVKEWEGLFRVEL